MVFSDYAKFPRDKRLDADFDKIAELIWYPYVGMQFGKNSTKIMVFGHNAYVDTKHFEQRRRGCGDRRCRKKCTGLERYSHVSFPATRKQHKRIIIMEMFTIPAPAWRRAPR